MRRGADPRAARHRCRLGRHPAPQPLARAARGQRAERRRVLDPDHGADAWRTAGGSFRSDAGPKAADGRCARRSGAGRCGARPGRPRTGRLPMAGGVEVTDAAIREVVRRHTCEARVRELARQLDAVCQSVALHRVEAGNCIPVTVVADADEATRLDPARRRFAVAEILGIAAVRLATRRRTGRPLAKARPRCGPASCRLRGRRRSCESRRWSNCLGGGRRSGLSGGLVG